MSSGPCSSWSSSRRRSAPRPARTPVNGTGRAPGHRAAWTPARASAPPPGDQRGRSIISSSSWPSSGGAGKRQPATRSRSLPRRRARPVREAITFAPRNRARSPSRPKRRAPAARPLRCGLGSPRAGVACVEAVDTASRLEADTRPGPGRRAARSESGRLGTYATPRPGPADRTAGSDHGQIEVRHRTGRRGFTKASHARESCEGGRLCRPTNVLTPTLSPFAVDALPAMFYI